jgi:hypothetical protein
VALPCPEIIFDFAIPLFFSWSRMYGTIMVLSPFHDYWILVSGRSSSIFLMNIGGCPLCTNVVLGMAYVFLLQALFLVQIAVALFYRNVHSFLLSAGGAESVS